MMSRRALASRLQQIAFGLGSRDVKTSALDIKRGSIVEHNGKPATVTKVVHTKGLARQGGIVDVEIKDLASGIRQSFKVKPSDTFDTRDDRVEHRDAQVLYSDSEGVHVMDGATFEQSVLDSSMLGEPGGQPSAREYGCQVQHRCPMCCRRSLRHTHTHTHTHAAFRLMGPGTSLKLLLYEGRVVSATAPDKVVGKVVETVAGVKSAKAGALKEALVRCGCASPSLS